MPDVPCFMIANFVVHDSETYRKYEKGFFPILKRHGGEFFTFDDHSDTLEGSSAASRPHRDLQVPVRETCARLVGRPRLSGSVGAPSRRHQHEVPHAGARFATAGVVRRRPWLVTVRVVGEFVDPIQPAVTVAVEQIAAVSKEHLPVDRQEHVDRTGWEFGRGRCDHSRSYTRGGQAGQGCDDAAMTAVWLPTRIMIRKKETMMPPPASPEPSLTQTTCGCAPASSKNARRF